MRKYTLNIDFFSEVDDHLKSYWLGFLAADGTLMRTPTTSPSGVSIELQSRDKEHLQQLALDVGSNALIKSVAYPNNKKQYRVRLCSKQFALYLMDLGFSFHKSYDLIFPKIPKELYSSFVLGYFDGDGSIYIGKQKPRLSITSTKEFLDSIRQILVAHCQANLATIHPISRDTTASRILYGGKPQIRRIRDWMYGNSPRCLLRKKEILYSF